MANSTAEYWDINGTSLSQYGWSVATIGGSRYDLPPRRGENITLAYRPGAIHRPKLADARVITLLMWVVGMDPATGASTGDQVLRWNDSWDFLRRLVWRADGSQVALTRRWRLTVSGSPAVVAATAQAEISDSMSPTMTGRSRADFSMNLLLADPFFYGPLVTTDFALSTPVVITNPGHDIAAHANLQVDFTGPLTNPRLTNTTPNPDVWVQYTGVIASGQTLRLNVGSFTALRVADGANLIGGISHAGSRFWMGLVPSTNTLTLTASSGSGSAQLRYQPPYV
jgi:hypothetical protein